MFLFDRTAITELARFSEKLPDATTTSISDWRWRVFGSVASCHRIAPQNIRAYATWLSHRDLAHLVDRCLVADISYEIFYGVSNNRWAFLGH